MSSGSAKPSWPIHPALAGCPRLPALSTPGGVKEGQQKRSDLLSSLEKDIEGEYVFAR